MCFKRFDEAGLTWLQPKLFCINYHRTYPLEDIICLFRDFMIVRMRRLPRRNNNVYNNMVNGSSDFWETSDHLVELFSTWVLNWIADFFFSDYSHYNTSPFVSSSIKCPWSMESFLKKTGVSCSQCNKHRKYRSGHPKSAESNFCI